MNEAAGSRKQHRLSIGVLFNGQRPDQEDVIRGIEEYSAAADLNVFAFDSSACWESPDSDAVKKSFANLVNKRLIEGLIVLAGAFPAKNTRAQGTLYKRFHPLPLVTVGFSLPGVTHVTFDYRRGLRLLVAHLAGEHGRRHIAYIAGPPGVSPSRELRADFEAALKSRRLSFNPRLVIEGDLSPESGRSAAARWAKDGPLACNAIIAANDTMAAGALQELLSRGLRVPEDCAVAGFGDDELASCACPPLSTVRVPLREAGARAAEALAAVIRGRAQPAAVSIPAAVVIRESCGCPPGSLADEIDSPAAGRRAAAAKRPTASRAGSWSAEAKADLLDRLPPVPPAAKAEFGKRVTELLTRLREFPKAPNDEKFLAVWRSLLRLAVGLGHPLEPWLDRLASLRRFALARFPAACTGNAGVMFRRAAVIGADIRQSASLYGKCLFPRHAMRLRGVEHKLLTTTGLPEIKKIILEEFPALGLSACYFSLPTGSDSPLHYSSLAAGYDREGPLALAARPPQFITNRLFPPGVIHSGRRRTFFIEPLYQGEKFLGLFIFAGRRIDLALHGILRNGLRDALANTSRLGAMNGEKADLESQLAGQSRALLETDKKWQQEKRVSDKLRDELNRSEARYQKWFEEDFTGNFIAAANGDIINCNSAFARIFGFRSVAEAHGANFGDFYPNKSALEDFYTLLGVVRRIEYYESEFVRKDGSVIHIIGNIIGSFDEDGALIEMQGFLFDNTERKHLEEELRHAHKMDAIGRLAGGIAHDFNNILTGIMGYSELLLNKIPKSDPSQRDVEEIKKAAKSAASLTRQLLAFSRKQIMQPLLLDLNDVVQSMRDLLIRIIGEHITFVTELDPELKSVKVDRGQIEQVIMNLVINSRDALPQGGTIVVTTRNKSIEHTAEFSSAVDIKPGPYVVLEVCDNGIGMDLETQSHIFEPFFSTKKIGQGVGLGLSTVYGIITQSGGFPEVMSEPHRGTTMRIYLPQYTSTGEVREERLQYQDEVKGTETILLVEDEDFVRELAEKVLSREGYHVIAAHNAQEALSLVKKHSLTFDLVVTDIVMPGISGVELGQKIQALRPEIKVLYMSGYDDKMLSQHSENRLRLNFIQKPFTPEILLRKVQDALNR